MHTFEFEAFGTKWAVITDDSPLSEKLKRKILKKTDEFEIQFSRFKPNTQVVQFRNAQAGTYTISNEFAKLLEPHQELKHLTQNAFDPAVGGLLEQAGYDAEYSFKTNSELSSYTVPTWELKGQTLSISGPIVFDIGGIGKGFWIDQVAQELEQAGHSHYLVDGGRDIFATTKTNGEGWNIALEYPGKPQLIIGTYLLKNQGLAASDTVQRRWGDWNHLVDIENKQPQNKVLGCVAVAKSALAADQMTSALSLCSYDVYNKIAEKLEAEYLIFTQDSKITISVNWSGRLFRN